MQMTILELKRVSRTPTPGQLTSALNDPVELRVESIGTELDFTTFETMIEEITSGSTALTREVVAGWDRQLAPVLHGVMSVLPRAILADMGVWHWLCIVPFKNLVWLRWRRENFPGRVEGNLPVAQRARFLGTPTLNGVSRNTLARLYWVAHALHTPEDGYRNVDAALRRQDAFQAIFERRFGLYSPAARAMLEFAKDRSELEVRAKARDLNHALTTIAVEALPQDGIQSLIQDIESP